MLVGSTEKLLFDLNIKKMVLICDVRKMKVKITWMILKTVSIYAQIWSEHRSLNCYFVAMGDTKTISFLSALLKTYNKYLTLRQKKPQEILIVMTIRIRVFIKSFARLKPMCIQGKEKSISHGKLSWNLFVHKRLSSQPCKTICFMLEWILFIEEPEMNGDTPHNPSDNCNRLIGGKIETVTCKSFHSLWTWITKFVKRSPFCIEWVGFSVATPELILQLLMVGK